MSGIEVQHAGLEWVKETIEDRQNQGIKIYTNSTEEQIQNNLKIHFELKPIFKIASVRVGSDAEKVGLKVGDRIINIRHQSAHNYTIQMINELLKSEEGKIIEIDVERDNKTYKFKFELKKII
jgi:C-terminal processing protease CtpA/Prc